MTPAMKLILPMLFVLLIAEVPTVIELCVLTYDPQTGDKLPLSKRFLLYGTVLLLTAASYWLS